MRHNKITRHHLIPKQRKKLKTYKVNQVDLHIDEVLHLWRNKHDYWHFLFKNMCLDEIIECLQRIKRIKSSKPLKHEKVA